MAKPKCLFLNGEIVPWDEGKVHVSSAAFKFGTGVFEGIRGYWNDSAEQMYLFRLQEHLQRLVYSQTFMRFEQIIQPDYVAAKLIELLRTNELRETVHIMTTAYVSGTGGPTTCGPIDLAITAGPLARPKFRDTGCSAQVSSWQRIADNAMPVRIKCNANYQNGRIAALQANADGYDTSILMTSRGKIAEGPGMCFFMIRGGVAVTPTVTNDILESITRETVMELVSEYCGIDVVERDIDRTELISADEAFYCGTAWEVTPIVSIDKLPVGNGEIGPVVKKLQRTYAEIVTGQTPDHPEWRTPVYEV